MSSLEIGQTVTAAAPQLLEPDRNQLEQFFDALFRHRGDEGFISFRSFFDDEISSKPFRIEAVPVKAGFKYLVDVAEDHARRAANEPKRIVFCPPIAVFNNKEHAAEQDLIAGLALSVECDQHPIQARARLEQILGPATVVVRSGGEWQSPRLPQDKLHLHFRLTRAAHGKEELAKLKRLRRLAVRFVSGDATNVPIVHPIRWPGSWHRKREPRLCEVVALEPDREIDLDAAIAALAALEAAAPEPRAKSNGKDQTTSEQQYSSPNWQKLIADILTAEKFHGPITRLAMKLLRSGMHDAAAVNLIRGWMEAAAPEESQRSKRWQARYDDVPRALSTAREKIGENKQDTDNKVGDELPELLINETNLPATAKELARLIAGLGDFVFNGTAPARIAVDGDCMPRAIEAAPESVCVHGHEICRPMRLQREKGRPKKEK
jgi:hypothetical protein